MSLVISNLDPPCWCYISLSYTPPPPPPPPPTHPTTHHAVSRVTPTCSPVPSYCTQCQVSCTHPPTHTVQLHPLVVWFHPTVHNVMYPPPTHPTTCHTATLSCTHPPTHPTYSYTVMHPPTHPSVTPTCCPVPSHCRRCQCSWWWAPPCGSMLCLSFPPTYPFNHTPNWDTVTLLCTHPSSHAPVVQCHATVDNANVLGDRFHLADAAFVIPTHLPTQSHTIQLLSCTHLPTHCSYTHL